MFLFGMPIAVIFQHLVVVTYVLICVFSLRILLFSTVSNQKWHQGISILILTTLIFVSILYYVLAVIGLESWNKVISKELFMTYLRQSTQVAASLEVSLAVIVTILIVAYGVCLLVAKKYVTQFDAAPKLSLELKFSKPVIAFTSLIMALAVPSQLYCNALSGSSFEPLTITFYATQAAYTLQGNHIDTVQANKLDAQAAQLRQTYQPERLSNPKNLVLIVVDALRFDKLNINGYKENISTPFLNKLNAETKIRNAGLLHASCGESACGMQSLISSLSLGDFSFQPFTIHDVMRKHGYQVRMILGGDHTNFYGLRNLYGKVDHYYDGSMTTDYMNDDSYVLEQTIKLPVFNQTPVMLQFHLMSVHTLGEKKPKFKQFLPASNYRIDKTSMADLQNYNNYYDNGVLQADYYVEQILTNLDKKGYLNNAVIAITTDHGESIGEHGKFRHANSVYEQLLRIPFLLVDWHGGNTARINTVKLASQIDIAPTILQELGMPQPSIWQGYPLQQGKPHALSSFQQNTDTGLYDLRHPNRLYKYWKNSINQQEVVYDLMSDPQESNNLLQFQSQKLLQEWRKHITNTESTAMISKIRD